MSFTIEGLAKAVGLFAAYFAIYESYIGFFQPNGVEQLELELGKYYDWFFRYNQIDDNFFGIVHTADYTTSDKAKFVALLQLVAALPVVLVPQRHRLYGLCLLSWFYMVAVRGHALLRTQYVPVVMTMFGFSHVALVTHVLGGFFTSKKTSDAGSEGDETDEPAEASTTQEKSTAAEATKKGKRKNNKKKSKTG